MIHANHELNQVQSTEIFVETDQKSGKEVQRTETHAPEVLFRCAAPPRKPCLTLCYYKYCAALPLCTTHIRRYWGQEKLGKRRFSP